ADAGAGAGEVDGVGAEAPGGQAEAGARPGGRLEEEIDDDLALEVVAFAVALFTHFDELFGGVENDFDLGPAQVFEAEQMTASPGGYGRPWRGEFRVHTHPPDRRGSCSGNTRDAADLRQGRALSNSRGNVRDWCRCLADS